MHLCCLFAVIFVNKVHEVETWFSYCMPTGLQLNLVGLLGQDAQLSQRDRAAGRVIVFAKSRRRELEDNILWTL